MTRLDRIPRDSLPFVSGTAYSPQEIITAIAELADIPYTGDVSDFPNGAWTYNVTDADISIATARDLLSCTVQTLGALAYIDRWGVLQIRQITKTDPVAEIGAEARTAHRVSRLPYQLYELDTTMTFRSGEGTEEVRRLDGETLWADGVTAELPENPLWSVITGGSTRAIQAFYIIVRALDPVTFAPGEAVTLGDPTLDPLDWVTVEGAALPVTASDWHYRGGHTVGACGTDAVAGIAQTQAEKAALAERMAIAEGTVNFERTLQLMMIQSSGHQGMALHTHAWLAHYTHAELGNKEGEA